MKFSTRFQNVNFDARDLPKVNMSTSRTGSAETEGARQRADSHSRKTTGYEPHTRDEQKIRIAPTAGHMQGIRYGRASLREKSGGRGGGGGRSVGYCTLRHALGMSRT